MVTFFTLLKLINYIVALLQSHSETSVFLRIHSSWCETRKKPSGTVPLHTSPMLKEITPISVIRPSMRVTAGPTEKRMQFYS
jgi:hypothetical protein